MVVASFAFLAFSRSLWCFRVENTQRKRSGHSRGFALSLSSSREAIFTQRRHETERRYEISLAANFDSQLALCLFLFNRKNGCRPGQDACGSRDNVASFRFVASLREKGTT